MSRVSALLTMTLVFVCGVPIGASQAGQEPTCTESGSSTGADSIIVSVTCEEPETFQPSNDSSNNDVLPTYRDYRFASPCVRFNPDESIVGAPDCAIAQQCASPLARAWDIYGLATTTNTWEYLNTRCYEGSPTAADLPVPTVTPGLVLNAIRQIGLPSLEIRTQPRDKTLVNFATIFYAEPEVFTRTIQLLGQEVEVEATPSRYAWHHGDGSTATTTGPGAPYPSQEITHSYTRAHTTVSPRVDVTYTARFRVGGGAWQDIGETVTISGPAGSLRISEATAVLSGEHD